MFKFYTMFMVTIQLEKIGSNAFWKKVAGLNETDIVTQIEIYDVFYWLNSGIVIYYD